MMRKLKLLTGLNAIVILVYSLAALFILPLFSTLFEAYGPNLPLATRLVVDTYHYWWLVPVVFFVLYLLLHKPSMQSSWLQQSLLVLNYGFAILEVLFIPYMVIAIYLPIIHLAGQV